MTSSKPSYEELQDRVQELENELCRREMNDHVLRLRELFEKIFKSQRDAIFILNAEFPPTIVDCNPAAEKLFGYSRDEMLGKDTEFLHVSKDGLNEFRKQLYPHAEEQGVFRLDMFMMKRKDGKVFHTEHDVMPLNNEKGERTGWVSVVRDVTDRVKVEEELRDKDAIFSAFLEHSPIYVFFKDRNIRPIYLSKNYEQMLGMPLSQVIGKSMDELFPSDLARSMIKDDMQVLQEGKRIDVIEEFEGRVYETIKFPVLKDAEPFILAGFTMDITERKRAEEALRESEKRYRQLFNHAPAGIYEVDFHKQRFIAVNDIMCQYTGYGTEEFLSMSPFDILSEDGKALYAQRCKKLLAGKKIPDSIEYKIRKKDGEELWVALNVNPVYEDGQIKGATAVVHNITERRKVEEKLRQSEERLRSLSAELMIAQEKERRRISKELHDELGQLLAILKHRVRSTGKRLLVHEPQMSLDSHATVKLVDDLIQKVRQISSNLNPSLLDDAGLCPALRSLADNFMREYGIPVNLEIDEIDAFFSKDAARNLFRILQELFTNIAKHADASHVNVQISKGPEYAYFLIEDDGKGFDATEARARDRRQKGLGLRLIEERADSIGGTLEIGSREGIGGTRILLTVPLEKGDDQ